jgi:cyanoexosortase A
MKDFSPKLSQIIYDPRFYLFAIALGLSIARIVLSSRVIYEEDTFIDLLCIGSIFFLLWQKRNTLQIQSDLGSSFLGAAIIILVTVKSLSLYWYESSFLRIATILSALGLGLLASGIKGLRQYWRELAIVVMLCLPTGTLGGIVNQVFNFPILTAKFSTFVMWYMGLEVTRKGVVISLPHGGVEVIVFCTGLTTSLLLVKLSVLSTFVYLKNIFKGLILALSSVLLAFSLGSFRVIIMALVVADKPNFEFWHGASGNQIFSTIGVLIFGFLCNFLHDFPKPKPEIAESVSLEPQIIEEEI